MLVKGGHLDESMPTGAPGRYTLKKSSLNLDVLGREYAGKWINHQLSVNDYNGIYLGPTHEVFPEPDEDNNESSESEKEIAHEYEIF